MSTRNTVLAVVVVALLAVCGMQYVFAQEGGGGGGGGSERRFDPADMRQRSMDSVKESLAATEEEWKALQPKVEKVYVLLREPGVAGGLRSTRRRSESVPPPAPESAMVTAAKNLENALSNKESKPEEVKAALDAFRAARDKGRLELAAARQELKASVSARQEAQLVFLGYLE